MIDEDGLNHLFKINIHRDPWRDREYDWSVTGGQEALTRFRADLVADPDVSQEWVEWITPTQPAVCGCVMFSDDPGNPHPGCYKCDGEGTYTQVLWTWQREPWAEIVREKALAYGFQVTDKEIGVNVAELDEDDDFEAVFNYQLGFFRLDPGEGESFCAMNLDSTCDAFDEDRVADVVRMFVYMERREVDTVWWADGRAVTAGSFDAAPPPWEEAPEGRGPRSLWTFPHRQVDFVSGLVEHLGCAVMSIEPERNPAASGA